MIRYHFICYSTADAKQFALDLRKSLSEGSIPVWLDDHDLQPGRDWDEQVVEALRTCRSLIFLMTPDSVLDNSECKREWTRALKYKKPIVPLLLHPKAEMPIRLDPRQYIEFIKLSVPAMDRLRQHLQWLDSPEGRLQELKDRLSDAQRDMRRAVGSVREPRIQADIDSLEEEIAAQQQVVADPRGTAQRVEESIRRGQDAVALDGVAVREEGTWGSAAWASGATAG